jgi:hypothetical protein
MRATAGGRRRDDVRLASHLEWEVRSIPLRNAYSERFWREVLRGQRIYICHFLFAVFCFQSFRGEK